MRLQRVTHFMRLEILARSEKMDDSYKVVERYEYGGTNSVQVENVQALASKNLKEIPHRFLLRSEDEPVGDVVVDDESLRNQIPVIDMSKLGVDHDHHDELARLHSACKDWGFFQLINHGIPKEVIERIKIDTEEFFQLPLEKKKAYAQVPNNLEGYGRQTFVVSENESLDWTDSFFLVGLPVVERNMRFWPTDPASFRESLDKYSLGLEKVQTRLLEFMSTSLGLDSGTLCSMFEGGRQPLRMSYYPPCAQAKKVMGLSPHSDSCGLTLLLQVNDVQGLQIKKEGKWVLVNSIPDALVVNIGDAIEMMSNGEYKSAEHRVVVNPERHRLSIAVFHGPPMKTMIGPLPALVGNNKAKYKTISYEDYMSWVLQSSKLNSKSLIDRMKIY